MITVPVRHVTAATPRTRIINLDLGTTPFSYSAGQAVMVGLHDSPLRKPYSIASAPWEVTKTGTLQLLAQVDDSGALDPHLELAAPGALLDLEGPFGSFGLPSNNSQLALLFVAGGTGIAPLRAMLMERLAQPDVPPVSVVYSARSADEFSYRAELAAMAASGRVRVELTVTRDEGRPWEGRRGRIDGALLRSALPSPEAFCLICGPIQLVSDARALLVAMGVKAEQILTEQY